MTISRFVLAAFITLAPLAPSASAGAQSGDLQGYVNRELNGLQAKSSIFAKHLASGRTVELHADIPMNTLSVIKLPIMILAFRDAEAGKLTLTDRYTIRPEDQRPGSGLLRTLDVGLSPTYREVFERRSPDDAEASRRSFLLEGDSTRWLGRTTARETATMLEGILTARYTSKHWPPVAGNDVGIIFYPGGPSIVSVFTNQNAGDIFELEATLGRIAEQIITIWK